MGDYIRRHYVWFALAILGLSLFNLTYRLGSEFVSEWDESLYAISAWEALKGGSWIGTTFLGQLDYYNSKPPLIIWLIALSFKAFGANLLTLRLASAMCAFLTVVVLQEWTRRCFGPAVALLASLVLATTFGFTHVHSGRSAATDAPFTLAMLLIVVTLWAARERPWRQVWLGPLLAAVFMMRGMAVLMPLALVLIALTPRVRSQSWNWRPALGATALFAAPVGAWLVARYRLDQWLFLERLFMYDFVQRSLEPIENHPGNALFYLDVLQKDHYDWLIAAVMALLIVPFRVPIWRAAKTAWRAPGSVWPLLTAWGCVTLFIPTMMQTKVAWYLNPFYPLFAILVALTLRRAFAALAPLPMGWRPVTLIAVFMIAAGVAEGKLLWYSWSHRDIGMSEQSLLLDHRQRLGGQSVFIEPNARATRFVAEALVGATPRIAGDSDEFLRDSRGGDYLLSSMPCRRLGMERVGGKRGQFLCRRPPERSISLQILDVP